MEQNLRKLQQEIRERYEIPELSLEQVERLKLKIQQAKRENHRGRVRRTGMRILAGAAGVVLMLFVLTNTSKTVAMAMQQIPWLGEFVKLITVRNYEYEDVDHHADINVGQLMISAVPELKYVDKHVKEELVKTTEEINMEIQKAALELMENFEEGVQDDVGHEEIIVESEVLTTTEDYFVVKIFCYQGLGSGYQWNYYYTIDLNTGRRLQLGDLFKEDEDYIGKISENIISQMKRQMEEDESKVYWLDNSVEEWCFTGIRADETFYVNADGNVVICFAEGDVAPMYMGALEFVIDEAVLSGIRK